jgi:hypothetical protein
MSLLSNFIHVWESRVVVELMDAVEVDVYLMMMEMLRPDGKLDMSGMWKEKIPKLKLRIYQLDRYVFMQRCCKF